MKNYTKITTDDGYEFIQVDDGGVISSIPIDPGNSDYQAYLDRDKPQAALSIPIVVEHLTEIPTVTE